MRTARKLLLLAVSAIAALAMMAPAASATEPVEIIDNATGVHCPPLAQGGCVVHAEGEGHLFGHLFGIESTEAECHVEFEGTLDGDGNGSISTYTNTNGAHGDTNCATVAPACAGSLPWPGVGEEILPNVLQGHFDVCIDPSEIGTCTGEYITTVTETGGPYPAEETQHYHATDIRIGSSSFCEVTLETVETEHTDQNHDAVHIRHQP